MSLIENLRGRGESEEPGGGNFNPFRILEIGESMIRYCDGIRIKNYNFLAILTSDRLVLIESAQQSAGTIAKEIPVSMIKGAEMERDEKNRPALAMNMEVGGQTRLMKLVFTGLIDEPETECREWFAAINGYPPEPQITQVAEPEVITPPPSPPPQAKPGPVIPSDPSPIIDAEVHTAQVMQEAERAPDALKPEPEPAPAPASPPASVPDQVITAQDLPAENPPVPVTPVSKPPLPQATSAEPVRPEKEQRQSSISAPGGDSIQISIEKPALCPVQLKRRSMFTAGGSGGKSRFCMHCGSRVPYTAKFCPVCGKTQA